MLDWVVSSTGLTEEEATTMLSALRSPSSGELIGNDWDAAQRVVSNMTALLTVYAEPKDARALLIGQPQLLLCDLLAWRGLWSCYRVR